MMTAAVAVARDAAATAAPMSVDAIAAATLNPPKTNASTRGEVEQHAAAAASAAATTATHHQKLTAR